MAKSRLIYQADQVIFGQHIKNKEGTVLYIGKLSIYDRKTYPVVLKLKCDFRETFIGVYMDEKIVFKGNTVADVFGKLSNYYYKHDILFRY